MTSLASRKSGISSTKHAGAGLQILTQISGGESNVVVKYGLKSLTRSTLRISSSSKISRKINTNDGDYCFLKSCHMCNKPLNPEKDVFMYRGDQGFCSVECRNRQIMLDEVKEMEAKTKKRLAASSVNCHGCETCRLLEDLRQRRNRRNYKPFYHSKQHQPLLSIFS